MTSDTRDDGGAAFPVPDGFTKWDGSADCPVPGKMVVPVFLGDLYDGAHEVREPLLAESLFWHGDGTDQVDIVAYCVVSGPAMLRERNKG